MRISPGFMAKMSCFAGELSLMGGKSHSRSTLSRGWD